MTHRAFLSFWSPAYITAGLVPILVGYSSAAAIVFQAARTAGAGPVEVASWMWALGIGMGIGTIALTFRYKVPVIVAWSTPGAALLVTALPGVPMAEAIGAFLFSSVLLTLCGVTGFVDRILTIVPQALAAAMLAGVLTPFSLAVFPAMEEAFPTVGTMVAVYVLGKRSWPRYAVPVTFFAGALVVVAMGEIALPQGGFAWAESIARPVGVWPAFDPATLVSVGIPLFIVTMASQNLPGVAVIRVHGYHTPASPLIGWTGGLGLALGPFGGFAFNLSAITAAICMGPDVHPDPKRRYPAGYWCGVFYILAGVFGGAVASAFAALPASFITAIAGLALLGTVAMGLKSALAEEETREAAIVTFAVTASGMSLLSVGSAFWGIAIGLAVHAVMRWRTRKIETA